MKSCFGDTTTSVKITTKPCFPGHGACLFVIQSLSLLKNLGGTVQLSGREDPCWAKTWLVPLDLPPKRKGSFWTVLTSGPVFRSWGREIWSAITGTGWWLYRASHLSGTVGYGGSCLIITTSFPSDRVSMRRKSFHIWPGSTFPGRLFTFSPGPGRYVRWHS